MGIDVLALSLPSPASHWERLSSSHQASTCGTIEVGSLDLKLNSPVPNASFSKSVQMSGCTFAGKNSQGRIHHFSSLPKQSFKMYSSPSEAVVPLEAQEASSKFVIGNEKVGVLLLNLGGPETLSDVQPFLFNLFADPDIIRLPRLLCFMQKPLAQFISVVRAPKSKEGYASIGGGSPLRLMTDAQAEALRKSLNEKEVPAHVYVGMRYWHPFTEEAIEQIKHDGITKLVVLPLYPQFSISTSGSSLRLLESIFREDEYLVNMQHTVIPSWYQRDGYIKAMANLIEEELKKFKEPVKK